MGNEKEMRLIESQKASQRRHENVREREKRRQSAS
jgi:hypothetical protein